jgi:hypothetical protein
MLLYKAMKKAFIIILIVICLVGAALAIYSSYSSKNSGTTDSEGYLLPTATVGVEKSESAEFVIAFYNWYLMNRVQNPVFPYTEDSREALNLWLTDDFYNNWDEQVTNSNGADPVLLTDENPPTSGTDFTATVVSESARGAIINLILSNGDLVQSYEVELSKGGDGDWKIASIYLGS